MDANWSEEIENESDEVLNEFARVVASASKWDKICAKD